SKRDWSSDVCSSDLAPGWRCCAGAGALHPGGCWPPWWSHVAENQLVRPVLEPRLERRLIRPAGVVRLDGRVVVGPLGESVQPGPGGVADAVLRVGIGEQLRHFVQHLILPGNHPGAGVLVGTE